MVDERNPVSVLHEWCQRNDLDLPQFKEENVSLSKDGQPTFSTSVTLQKTKYGPMNGLSKSDAKAQVAMKACDQLGLYHTGIRPRKIPQCRAKKNAVALLYEMCQANQWPDPTISLLKECKDSKSSNDKEYILRFVIGDKCFPCGAGRNKDVAKKRAAARALSKIKKVHVREHLRGPEIDLPFGQQVAEYSWEAFGILCEEFGENLEFCQSSNLACFLLEDTQDGSLRVVSIGTGSSVAQKSNRLCNGETVIDCHAIVIARRGLLVFLYEQLKLLLNDKESIFENSNKVPGKLCALKERYQVHVYMKDAPCGSAKCKRKTKRYEDVEVKNHEKFKTDYVPREERILSCKTSTDVASCSDKIFLWNFVGVQGSLLAIFIPEIYINSITLTNEYIPRKLVQVFCCRYGNDQIIHPWIQHGTVSGIDIDNASIQNVQRKKDWSVYWSLGELDLKADLEKFPANGGILDGVSGTHATGSERDGEIPIICKRNLYILFSKVFKLADKSYVELNKTYAAQKQLSVLYKKKKNEFFEHIEMLKLGRYPIVDREIDSFILCPEDLQL